MVKGQIRSMTGFAAGRGTGQGHGWSWDLRSVNGKGADLRLRVPDWIEGLEAGLRNALSQQVVRGSVSLTLKVAADGGAEGLRVNLPGLHAGDRSRVALEGYPGLLAREVLQRRSYKSDDRAKQTPDRLIARKDLVNALELGQTRLGLRLKLSHSQRDALVQDASGDSLDAVLCLLQAAWAGQRHAKGDALYGLPPGLDPLEGWIVTADKP